MSEDIFKTLLCPLRPNWRSRIAAENVRDTLNSCGWGGDKYQATTRKPLSRTLLISGQHIIELNTLNGSIVD